jgi:hypothetical protein
MKILSIHQYIKTSAIVLAIFFSSTFSQAQDITGQWKGILSFEGMTTQIIININKTDNGYTSTLDDLDEGVSGIPMPTTTFDGSKLSLINPDFGTTYEGIFKTDSIVGTVSSSEISLPLILKRVPAEAKPAAKP